MVIDALDAGSGHPRKAQFRRLPRLRHWARTRNLPLLCKGEGFNPYGHRAGNLKPA